MCGIFGFSGEFDHSNLAKIATAISHRGPDDSGIYNNVDARVALVHTRLAIIDLSPAGHQPMISPNGEVAIVFNGEIYNFRELRLTLERKGIVFKGNSDTEVLLHLYMNGGLNFLESLNGIFTIAIFDNRTSELMISRDGLGVKPLYYYKDERGLVFSSEIKAMKPFFAPSVELDLEAIDRYLTYLYCPGNQTPILDIKKLDPGHTITIKNGAVIGNKQWYVLPQTLLGKKDSRKNVAIKKVRDGLRAAVHRQMVADVPVGAFLSGGLDSSAIVALAKEINPNIHCFTIEQEGGSDDGDHNDLPYAKRAAKYLGVSLDVVTAKAGGLALELEKMIWHLDEPLADPAALNVLYISRLARENGIKVLLSGAGGDDLFTGYRRHLALRYEKLWTWLPSPVLRRISHMTQSLNQESALGYKLNKLFSNAEAIGDRRITKYFSWAQREKLNSLYSDRMKEIVKDSSPERPLLDFMQKIEPGVSDIDRMLALEQRFFLSDHNLNYTDKMSMAEGVEVRVPFLDPDLLNIAASIPSGLKQNGRIGKWVLKKAMEPYLPRDIIYRPKAGFGAPIRRWIKNDLRDMVRERLTFDALSARGIFDPIAVQKLITDNEQGIYDGAHTIFSILCIEIWCTLFIDNKTPLWLPSELNA
jgi:asparagine synthase (glutamine-hydrolysing)